MRCPSRCVLEVKQCLLRVAWSASSKRISTHAFERRTASSSSTTSSKSSRSSYLISTSTCKISSGSDRRACDCLSERTHLQEPADDAKQQAFPNGARLWQLCYLEHVVQILLVRLLAHVLVWHSLQDDVLNHRQRSRNKVNNLQSTCQDGDTLHNRGSMHTFARAVCTACITTKRCGRGSTGSKLTASTTGSTRE